MLSEQHLAVCAAPSGTGKSEVCLTSEPIPSAHTELAPRTNQMDCGVLVGCAPIHTTGEGVKAAL